jgi:hypothetical protein
MHIATPATPPAPRLDTLDLPGCFGMTELGHGSNVMGIETTAVYDAAAGEFVINTPDNQACKAWIGGAAQHGKVRGRAAAACSARAPPGPGHSLASRGGVVWLGVREAGWVLGWGGVGGIMQTALGQRPPRPAGAHLVAGACPPQVCTVFAQLTVNGKWEGPHVFVVRIRDDNSSVTPGGRPAGRALGRQLCTGAAARPGPLPMALRPQPATQEVAALPSGLCPHPPPPAPPPQLPHPVTNTAGVRIQDHGPKMGLNGVDNGRIWFDHVRVQRDAMLDAFASVDAAGNYSSSIPTVSKRFGTMVGGLTTGASRRRRRRRCRPRPLQACSARPACLHAPEKTRPPPRTQAAC